MHLKIITHENIIFDEDVNEMYLKGIDGEFGILKGHEPIMAALDIGVTKIVQDNSVKLFTTMGGILQFAHNKATILTDIAELECNIDVARAKLAKERAEARLKAHEETLDIARAQIALAKSIARISAKEKRF